MRTTRSNVIGLFLIIIILHTVSDVSITQSINCDLGLVDFGEDIDCPIDVTYGSIPDDTSLTVTNIFNIVDSTNYTNSICHNPRITYTHIDIDYDGESDDNEYINLYEGSRNQLKIKQCTSHKDESDCGHQTCIRDHPLINKYINSASINITVYVADEVDTLCDDGNIVESTLTLTCQRAETMLCDMNQRCNDMDIDVNDVNHQMPFYLYCGGHDVCTNVTINGENVTEISILCVGHSSCVDMVINAKYAEKFSLFCEDNIENDNAVCNNIEIDDEYAQFVSISCDQFGCSDVDLLASNADNINIKGEGYNALKNSIIYGNNSEQLHVSSLGDYASDNIIIYGQNTNSININAEGKRSLTNSSIFGQNSNELDITCFSSGFDGETCLNTNIYLSSYEESNTLNCRFGCDKINLYFKGEIDTSLFKTITFKECSLCDTINECGNEWTIYYDNYNSSIVYAGNTIENENDLLSNFADYIDGRYSCMTHDRLQNETVSKLSITISTFCLSCFCVLLIILMIRIYIIELYRKCKHKYISNKPGLWILLYSICADIIIFIAIFWCGIKILMLYVVTKDYCSSKYQYDEDKRYCIDDKFCHYYQDGYKCEPVEPIWGMMLSWSIIFVLWIVYELSLNVVPHIVRLNVVPVPTEFQGAWWPTCDGLRCRMYHKLRKDPNELYNKIYATRQFWITRQECCGCNLTTPGFYEYFVYQLARYGALMILVSIIFGFYGDYDSDYTVKWYEYYPLLILIGSKMLLQIGYTFGNKYKPNQETEYVLIDKFGKHLAFIIKQFTPLFYDKALCSSDVLIKEIELNEIKKSEEIGLIGNESFTQTEFEDFNLVIGYE